MNLKKYFKIWWTLTIKASQIAFVSRLGAVIFILGKILRFFLFLFFLFILASQTKTIAGYSLWQIVFFFATFNLIDTLAQFFLREVYRFRSYIVSGHFDYFLTKPFSVLFRSLFGGSDVLDLSILLLSVIFIVISAGKLGGTSLLAIFLYTALVFNAFLIALALHIFVLSLGVLTTEVDNTIMLYRDLTQMGRVPIEIYREPLKGLLTFVIPVGIMMTFPAKAMMGLLSASGVIASFLVCLLLFFLSLKFWRFSLKRYASPSS